MAILQVKDIDDNLYEALKVLAKKKRRSLSQELIKIIELHLSRPSLNHLDATDVFLNLSWKGDKSAEEMVNDLRKSRKDSKRFADSNNVFD